jgi:uncharacterized membrane protein
VGERSYGPTVLWDSVLWLHLLAMAFFVGGQVMLAAVIVPVERANPDRARTRAMARRFGAGTLIALVVLAATGAAMATHESLWDDGTLQVKLGLVIATAGLVLVHLRRPRDHVLDAAIFVCSIGIVALGVALP